jgi:glutathione S-transferase
MSNDLKLYQSNGSPNSRRVRIYLAEKGICASTRFLDAEVPFPIQED